MLHPGRVPEAEEALEPLPERVLPIVLLGTTILRLRLDDLDVGVVSAVPRVGASRAVRARLWRVGSVTYLG